MAAFLESIDRIVAGSMRRSTSRNETYADWIANIPEPMFRQLVREGMYRTVVWAIAWELGLWITALAWPSSALHTLMFGIGILLLVLWGWRTLAAQCLLRECRYRRMHGKWRWEG